MIAELFLAGQVLVKWVPGADKDLALTHVNGQVVRTLPEIEVDQVSGVFTNRETAKILNAQPAVEWAEVDALLAPDEVVPNDPYWWHPAQGGMLGLIGATDAWEITTGSPAVTIAVVDSGIDSEHPDLDANVTPGHNVLTGGPALQPTYWHGTGVAGAAGAETDNGQGIAAIAWHCSLMPVQVTTGGLAQVSDIAAGIVWAADNGADVINVSYSVTPYDTVEAAAKYARQKGALTVCSAGNLAQYLSQPDQPNLVTVGATELWDVLAFYSNWGPSIDMVAPGDAITTDLGGTYRSGAGTSFAAPKVCAAAALLLSVDPSLSPAVLEALLEGSAVDLGETGPDEVYGHGRLDVQCAIEALLGECGGVVIPPGGDIEPPVVEIVRPGNDTRMKPMLQVKATATDNVGVVSVELGIDGVLVSVLTEPPWVWKVKTNGYTSGWHVLSCGALDAAGNLGVSKNVVVWK